MEYTVTKSISKKHRRGCLLAKKSKLQCVRKKVLSSMPARASPSLITSQFQSVVVSLFGQKRVLMSYIYNIWHL